MLVTLDRLIKKDIFKKTLLVAIFVAAALLRIVFFGQTGKDNYAYERAVQDLLTGINPYKWTIESYSTIDDPGNHGYAYLPLLMYLNSIFYLISIATKIPFEILNKIPVILCDLGVGIILTKIFYRKNFLVNVVSLLFWFWNPYFFIKSNYVYTDPLPVFLSLAALYYLEKDDVLAGVLLALSIAAKPYPAVLLPLFLFKSQKPLKLLAASSLTGLALSIPFMKSLEDFQIYMQGAIFVHGERVLQGRPFLFFISYYGKIEIFRTISLKLYAYASVILPWVATCLGYMVFKIKDKYVLATLCLLLFYLFTPVLNRTYLIWVMPFLAVASYNLSVAKKRVFPVSIFSFWAFYYVYLYYWKDGFHIWHP